MYIEKRACGTYYLRESKWDSKAKKPICTSIYLGKNSRVAYDKLTTLTQDEMLLSKLVHNYDCDEQLVKLINMLDSHKRSCDYVNINKVIEHCIVELERFWVVGSRSNKPHHECVSCHHYHVDYCRYFNQRLTEIEIAHPCRALQISSQK